MTAAKKVVSPSAKKSVPPSPAATGAAKAGPTRAKSAAPAEKRSPAPAKTTKSPAKAAPAKAAKSPAKTTTVKSAKAAPAKAATKATKAAPAPAAKKAAKAAPAGKKADPVKAAPSPAGKKAAPAKAAPAPAAPTVGPYAKDPKFLDEQRALLLEERSIYKGQAVDLRAEADSLALEREPGDVQFDEESGEGGPVTVDRERNLALSAQASAAVEEIDDAMRKIDRTTYGACERCHQPIPKARLRALPFARLCVACKSGGLSRR